MSSVIRDLHNDQRKLESQERAKHTGIIMHVVLHETGTI